MTTTDRECTAEFVDGSYDYESCGCLRCCEALHDAVERRYESGYLDDDEVRDEHADLSARGY